LREQFGFKGLALTCSSISLTHPVDESLLEIKTDLDPRLVKLLNQWDCSGSQLKEVMKK
jgi:tRNA pseudouridine65 synthase